MWEGEGDCKLLLRLMVEKSRVNKPLLPKTSIFQTSNLLTLRVVDGIEDDGSALESKTFSFNMDQPPQSSAQEHAVSGNHDNGSQVVLLPVSRGLKAI